MRFLLGITTVFLFLLATGDSLRAETFSVYQDGIESKDLDRLIAENTPGPDQDIRAVLLHKTENESIHLVLIRTAEKPHIHQSHDGFVVLKRGAGTLHFGEKSLAMKTGDIVFIPRGTVHYFVNTSGEPAVALGVFTPPYDGKDVVPAPAGSK